MAADATLTIIEGAGKGQSYPLAAKPLHVLGRGQHVDIPVLDIKCSREHARLEKRGNDWYLVDLGGTNGTRVNGQRLAKNSSQRLQGGDKVRLGEVTFGFEAVEVRAPVAAPWEVSGMGSATTAPIPSRPPAREPVRAAPPPPPVAATPPAADPFELAFDFDAAAPPLPAAGAPPPPPDAPGAEGPVTPAADREDALALRTFIFDEQPEFDPAAPQAAAGRPAEAADADALRTFVFDQRQPAAGGLELDAPLLDNVSEVVKGIPARQPTERQVAPKQTSRSPDPVLQPIALSGLDDEPEDFDAQGRTLDMAPLKPKAKQPEIPPGLKHTVVLDTSASPPPPLDQLEQDLGRTMMFDGQPDFSDLKEEEAPKGTVLLGGPPKFGPPGDTTAAPPVLPTKKKPPGAEPPMIDRTLVLDGAPDFGELVADGPPTPPPLAPLPIDRTLILDGAPDFAELVREEKEKGEGELGRTMILDAPPDFGSDPTPARGHEEDEGASNRTMLLDCPPDFGEDAKPAKPSKPAQQPPAIDRTLILDGPPEFGDEPEEEAASRTMMLDGPPEFGDGDDEEEKEGDAAGRTILLDGPPEFE